jgi:pimeloyl-ACP methyl ester carboxylesterase
MANIVLVHGAWHGGWCYRDTARLLRAAGHEVFTPTLSGVGERFHASSRDITLETHVRDVVGVVEAEELDDVILCGHSYGGMVITGAADRLRGRIKAMAYLDAFLPQPGESLLDLLRQALPPEVAAVFIGAFLANPDGLMAPIPAEMFGIRAENRPWVDRRCVVQPLATFALPLLVTNPVPDPAVQRLYILADAWEPSPFRHFAKQVDGQPGWQLAKVACGHDVMVDEPAELARLLQTLI